MLHSYQAVDINALYPGLIRACLTHGEKAESRGRHHTELHPLAFELMEPRRRVLTSRGRPINIAFALAEVLHILCGRSDVKMLEFYNSQIAQFSDNGTTFNAAYGYRLRAAHGYDQIDDAIRCLRRDTGSRQATMSIWHPNDQSFQPVGEGRVYRDTKDRACNLTSHMLVRKGELYWMQTMRSNDLIWGLPYNIIQWTMVQEWIAQSLHIPMGTYTHIAHSAHVYDWHQVEAEGIDSFDLYPHFDDHVHARIPGDESLLRQVQSLEYGVRTDDHVNMEGPLAEVVGKAWADILYVLMAHRCYKAGEDTMAARYLAAGDPVYGAAQARFYGHKRWNADPVQYAASYNEFSWWPMEVIEWIQSA